MQSEELDKKIREAADHHHPAYDEQAWMKMEKLLNKHLPQKKDDRRRFIFFILLFLLIGAAVTGLFILRDRNGRSTAAIAEQRSPSTSQEQRAKSTEPRATSQEPRATSQEPRATSQEPRATSQEPRATSQEPRATSQEPRATSQEPRATSQEPRATSQEPLAKSQEPRAKSQEPRAKIQEPRAKSQEPRATSQEPRAKSQEPRDTSQEQRATSTEPRVKSNQQPTSADLSDEAIAKSEATAGKPVPASSGMTVSGSTAGSSATTVIAQVPATENKKEATAKSNKDKSRNTRRSNSFSLNFTVGPDISIVGTSKAGKVNLIAGIGLGYTYKDRLTIRTGFYAANKVYSAEPGDYHPPSRFYYYYPNLQKIDANCRVYEIPVSLSYHFGNNKKQNWFVSSGISSYLMKRETYNYFYKQLPTQPTISKQRTLNGVNKHYFSVLTVSGGFQKNFNRSLSLTVEPYLKVPLSGIGYGKVKLNSSGVMFTVGVRPFDLFRKGK
ncbi:MAG: hypothetical protein ABIR30_05075 [Chitinophagaceae bacterium]